MSFDKEKQSNLHYPLIYKKWQPLFHHDASQHDTSHKIEEEIN